MLTRATLHSHQLTKSSLGDSTISSCALMHLSDLYTVYNYQNTVHLCSYFPFSSIPFTWILNIRFGRKKNQKKFPIADRGKFSKPRQMKIPTLRQLLEAVK